MRFLLAVLALFFMSNSAYAVTAAQCADDLGYDPGDAIMCNESCADMYMSGPAYDSCVSFKTSACPAINDCVDSGGLEPEPEPEPVCEFVDEFSMDAGVDSYEYYEATGESLPISSDFAYSYYIEKCDDVCTIYYDAPGGGYDSDGNYIEGTGSDVIDCDEAEDAAHASDLSTASSCGAVGLAQLIEFVEYLDDAGLGDIKLNNKQKWTWKGPRFQCWYYDVSGKLADMLEIMCTLYEQTVATMSPNFAGTNLAGMGFDELNSDIEDAVGDISSGFAELNTTMLSSPEGVAEDVFNSVTGSINASVEDLFSDLVDGIPSFELEPYKKKWRKSPCTGVSLPMLDF